MCSSAPFPFLWNPTVYPALGSLTPASPSSRFSSSGLFYASARPVTTRCSSFPAVFSGMNSSPNSFLFPLQRCKILHLVRHAQGVHNVAGEKDHSAYLSPELFDAHLTPLGWDQVDNLRRHVIARGLCKKIDLVITSPLLRTMQTAVGVFGGEDFVDGIKGQPLMVENAGNSGRPAISNLVGLPIIAVEACREHLDTHASPSTAARIALVAEQTKKQAEERAKGVHPCDRRRDISEYQKLFPAVDFSLIDNNEDTLWKPDVREANEEVAVRGINFIDWLWTLKETEIAVVTHSGFLFHTLQKIGKDFHPLIKDEICKHFGNCELRSMIIFDRSLVGLRSDSTNFPGKTPRGTDIPSNIALDKQPNTTAGQ